MFKSYIIRNSGEDVGPYVLVLLLAALTLAGLAALRNPLMAVVLVAGVVFIVTIGLKPVTLPAMFILYLCLAPSVYGGRQFEFFRVYYFTNFTPFVFFAIALVLFIHNTQFALRGVVSATARPQREPLDLFFQLLVVWVIFMALHGAAEGHKAQWLRGEILELFPFFGYFIWRRFLYDKTVTHRWMLFFILVTLATAIEYVLFVYDQIENILKLVAARMITRQIIITLASIPLLYAFLFSTKRHLTRLLLGLGLVLTFIHVFISQGRFIWMLTVFGSFLIITLYIFRKGFTRRALITWLLGLIVIALLLFLFLYLAAALFDINLSDLFFRWRNLGTLKDQSTLMRVFAIRIAFKHIVWHPIIGNGLGELIFHVPTAHQFYYIDNSYVVALLKGGIIYLFIILAIYLKGLWNAWAIFRRGPDLKTQMMGAGIFTALVLILIDGIATTVLLYYQFTFIWSMLLAASVVLKKSLPADKSLPEASP